MRHDLMEKFRADHADSVCTAFLIMRFSNKKAYDRIKDALTEAFQSFGIRLLRADDRAYSDDLFENVRLYADCCSFGVAVFDRIESEYFNPNVSLEVGFLMGRQKPVLLLKDDSISVLPADLVGKLYVPINVYEPEEGLADRIKRWLDDSGINPCSKRLSVVVRLQIPRWEYAATKDLVGGIPLFVRNAGPAYHQGIRQQGENFVIDYDVSEKFARELCRMYSRGELAYLAGIDILRIDTSDEQAPLLDYIYVDLKSENFEIQYCFLEGFEGMEDLAARAKKYLRPLTRDIKECSVFVSLHDGTLYVHSNFLLPGRVYPTKFIASRLDSFEHILPLVTRSTAASCRSAELAAAHMLDVTYIFDSVFEDRLPFDDLIGASRVKRLPCGDA